MLKEEDVINGVADLTLADRFAFMKLPIEERRRILAKHANELMAHYVDQVKAQEREAWQGGDIAEL
jgi:hypothetical protein